MKSKEEIKKWLLENARNEYDNVDLSGIDFGDVNLEFNNVRAYYIDNSEQKANTINNDGQKAKQIYSDGQVQVFMGDQNLIDLAIKQHRELCAIVELNKNKSIEELCEKFEGWNLDYDGSYFDFDYGCMVLTIHQTKDGYRVQKNDIEIWDNEKADIVGLINIGKERNNG